MDEWSLLGGWADRRLKALTITLLSDTSEGTGQARAGLMAVLESPLDTPPQGALCQAPFWANDWRVISGLADWSQMPAGGRILEIDARRYLLSPLVYNRSALVLGGGHVGGALCTLLKFLDFEVTLMDDRPDFLKSRADGTVTVADGFDRLSEYFAEAGFSAVAIVTRGHAQDSLCLRQVLSWSRRPEYLGMIGSRRRIQETMNMLRAEGFNEEALRRVHAPIGLDIGAQTPAEIAVSIGGEIIKSLS